MKYVNTLFLLLVLAVSEQAFAQCFLPKPNAVITSWTSCDATLAWDAIDSAAYYEVRYKIASQEVWTILPGQVTGTQYTFTNLTGGVEYKFGVAAYCSDGSTTGYKNAKKTTPLVNTPETLTSTFTEGTSVGLTWAEHCPVDFFNVRYKEKAKWVVHRNIYSTSFIATGLTPEKLYSFQVQAQIGNDTSTWTHSYKVNSGIVPPPPPPPPPAVVHPNIILYVLDDGRYDPYIPNGGPAWFNTPAINRIANEGINFKYAFPTTSQCAPSRVSIYTGLYAHKTGVVDNNSRRFDGLTMVQDLLREAGYYTGFVGKFGQFQGDPVGFDWWGVSDGNVFQNPVYKINGIDTSFEGHISDVYQKLAFEFLNSVPDGQKFMLMFFTRVPHIPTLPREEDRQLYVNNTMPIPNNFNQQYQYNYPSYFYSAGHKWNPNSSETDSLKLLDFQCLNGAEVNMQAMLDWLTEKSILDSTMIIFTSDNGYLQGEHKLDGKQLAQEESIRVPMFIRFPYWFGTSGIVNTNIMAANIDIAPTLLDAAGVSIPSYMDGTSLHKLYIQEVNRKYFYYQFAYDEGTPPIRSVRSNEYKYTKHYCTNITEEFYDLVNDPLENVNEINNPAFEAVIGSFRQARDSIALALGDPDPTPINCYLSNPEFGRNSNEETEEFNLWNVEVYPNPASQYFMINFNDQYRENIEVHITNMVGEKTYFKSLPNTNSFNLLVQSEEWLPGLYLVTVKKGDKTFNQKFTIQ